MVADMNRLTIFALLTAGLVACGGEDSNNSNSSSGGGGASTGATTSDGGGGHGGDGDAGGAGGDDGCRELSGTLDDDETLEGCIRVVSNVGIEANIDVAPGTVIEFAERTSMTVWQRGSLVAVGTETEPITFTGADKEAGFYVGLVFSGSYDSKNRLEHVLIEHAGFEPHDDYPQAAVYLTGAPVRADIVNTTVRNNNGPGVRLDVDAELGAFNNNTISGNAYPINMPVSALGSIDATSSYGGNEDDVVFVWGISDTPADSNATWSKLDVPYQIAGVLRVDATVRVEPGVLFLAQQDAEIRVRKNGSFSAVGTPSDPITFTAIDQLPGYWTGIHYDATVSSGNELEHVVVEYGGASEHGSIMIDGDDGNCTARLANVMARHSSQWGVFVYGQTIFGGLATVLGDRSTVLGEDNADGDIGLSGHYEEQW